MSTPLRKIRKARGLTLAKLAELTGSDAGNISRIERGIQTPSKELAEKLASVFSQNVITEIEIIFPERFSS